MANQRLQQLKDIKAKLPELFEQIQQNPSDLNNTFHMIASLASAISVLMDLAIIELEPEEETTNE